ILVVTVLYLRRRWDSASHGFRARRCRGSLGEADQCFPAAGRDRGRAMLGREPSPFGTEAVLSEQKNRSFRARTARAVQLTAAAFVAIHSIAGCATSPPVQEMSDAREAIAAAEEASAAELAPGPLSDARRFLETAEQLLRDEA